MITACIGLLDNVGESSILDFHTYRSCGRCKERFPVGNYSCSVPELIANHLGGLQSPILVTNCSPLTIVVDLNDTPTNVILVFWRDKAYVIFFQKEKGKQRKKQREGKEIITNLQCLFCRLATPFVLATNVWWAYRKRKYRSDFSEVVGMALKNCFQPIFSLLSNCLLYTSPSPRDA